MCHPYKRTIMYASVPVNLEKIKKKIFDLVDEWTSDLRVLQVNRAFNDLT